MTKKIFSRYLLRGVLFTSIMAMMIGCGSSTAPTAPPLEVPQMIDDQSGQWLHVNEGPSESDNQRIAQFFESNPELLGSPDWSGKPEKYQLQGSVTKTRLYWFHGSTDNPTWSRLEFQGSSVEKLQGQGLPGNATSRSEVG